jgi:1-acyl-sn-glycerol-3-phosphate acyltransferase
MNALWRRGARAVRVITHLLTGSLICALWLAPAARWWPIQARDQRFRIVRWWMRKLLAILRVQVNITGVPESAPALLVANHISWLDIPCLLGSTGATFVSKREVADWPLIGSLAGCSGTIFLERGHGAAAAIARMFDVLTARQCVVVFPEGTSTDGSRVLPFHPRLFEAAIAAAAPVQAVAIRYPRPMIDAPRIEFVGDDAFVPHLWQLLAAREIVAELIFFPARASGHRSRRELAESAAADVRAVVEAAVSNPSGPAATISKSSCPATAGHHPGRRGASVVHAATTHA